MLVTADNLNEVLDDIGEAPLKGLDTETYGLRHEDRLFSVIISTPRSCYYFNFCDKPDHKGNYALHVLHRERTLSQLATLYKAGKWSGHNIKYDLQKIALEGFGYPKNIHCTLATERLIRNDLLDYSLEAIAPRYGLEKSTKVEEYIKEHKLYTKVFIPGKKKVVFNKHFDQVPFTELVPYAELDARLARLIAERQLHALAL